MYYSLTQRLYQENPKPEEDNENDTSDDFEKTYGNDFDPILSMINF